MKANYDYSEYGISVSMLFIARATMSAAAVLKNSPIQSAPIVLSSPTYQDIDLYIVYTVQVFYMMEDRVNK